MPITSFRGEKSVAEIADVMFERLTPKQREKAEAAILKANPRLNDLSTLPRGAVLKVPDLPELRAKARRAADDPPARIASEIGEALIVRKHLDDGLVEFQTFQQTLDLKFLVPHHQRGNNTLGAGACSTARTMQVRL